VTITCDALSSISFYETVEYKCETNTAIINSAAEQTVTSVITANHELMKTNDDVKLFWIFNSNVKYFPRGIETFFVNLVSVTIHDCGLTEIRKADLQGLTKLEFLILYKNSIVTIEKDLFIYNPQLMFIDLSENKIASLEDVAVFDSLANLNYLFFYNNVCASGTAHEDKIEVEKLICTIKCKCKTCTM
jgi:hypothetical protein